MQADSNSLFPYWLILFIALGVALMGLTYYLNSFISGWYKLSKRFRAQSEPYGQTRSVGPFFYSVCMRYWGNYYSEIRLTAAEDTLYLSVLFPFRVGHPLLCIPWNEIQIGRTEFLWRRYVVLTLGNEEKIPMRISEGMAHNLGRLERIPN